MSRSPVENRPWTVLALSVLSAGGAIWGLIDRDRGLLWASLLLVLGVWITLSLWNGKQWVFTLSFMGSSAVVGLLLLVFAIQTFLFEGSPAAGLLAPLALAVTWMILLMRPETRAFVDRMQRPNVATQSGAG